MSTLSFQFTEGGSKPESVVTGRKQLLPNIVDGMARSQPNRIFARMPKSATSWEDGVRRVTYRELANAVNGMAIWLVETLGKVEIAGSRSVAYFGLFDARYQILTLAAIKTGYKIVFPSALQGIAGLLDIFGSVDCSTVITANRSLPILATLAKEAPQVEFLDAPSLNYLLDGQHAHFEYTKTFEEARHDAFLVLHTSGSTGSPKPITYTNDWVAAWAQQALIPPPPGSDTVDRHFSGIDMLSFGPPAHVSGLMSMVIAPLCHQITGTYPLPGASFTLSSLIETLRYCPVDLLLCGSGFLDAIALDTKLLAFVKTRAKMMGYAGGPLSRRTGDILSKDFMVFPVYGTSENGVQTNMIPSGGWQSSYWRNMNPAPSNNAEMRPIEGSENLYELVIVRNPDPEKDAPIFKMFPHLTEWSTKDVFIGHSTTVTAQSALASTTSDDSETKVYAYSHRLTDTITLILPDQALLVNTIAVNPLEFEQALSGTELIKAALVFGHRRSFLGLLIELEDQSVQTVSTAGSVSGRQSTTDVDPEVLEKVWQQVQARNGLGGIRVEKRHIIFTAPARTLPRASKGTVQRAAALDLYDEEINDIYRLG